MHNPLAIRRVFTEQEIASALFDLVKKREPTTFREGGKFQLRFKLIIPQATLDNHEGGYQMELTVEPVGDA